MSNTSIKVAIALFMVLTPPAASFARGGGGGGGGGGHGGGHAGFSAMGAFSRPAGSAGTGNVPISGIAPGPANAGGIYNTKVDPSGIGNAARVTTLPQPNIPAPMLPGGSRIPAALPPMTAEPSTLEEASGTHLQPRVGQAPSEKDLTNPNDPVNQENAALDRMLNICRGC